MTNPTSLLLEITEICMIYGGLAIVLIKTYECPGCTIQITPFALSVAGIYCSLIVVLDFLDAIVRSA